MDGESEIERAVRKLSVEHAETRWLSLRLDDDVKEIRQELRTMHADQTARFDSIDGAIESIDGALESIDGALGQHGVGLQEHGGRLDSVDAQLRTLTQMVGQVLERLPEEPGT
jgi:ABC-type transporter Mla subunit MlaD